MRHVTIFRETGRYAGWPANYGIWCWGNEIVLGFIAGFYNAEGGFHARDRSRAFESMQARSLDGGHTWEVQKTPCRAPGNRGLSADEHMNPGMGVGDALEGENAPTDCDGGIDFSNPDFALMCARTGLEAGARSFFYISSDRCRSWQGPYNLPMFDQTGIAARTDYLVSGREKCTLFLTASKRNGEEGRVFCARTANGGKSFDFLSWIGLEPEGYAIMPSSVRLSGSRILVAVRCRGTVRNTRRARNWIDLYGSDDDGVSWTYRFRPVSNTGFGGNPPTLMMLHDGRLCLTYGYRDPAFGLRAKLSEDEGTTWGKEIVLRDDGGNHDLGYARTVQRTDGKIVTAYYYNDSPEEERYIAATIWHPSS